MRKRIIVITISVIIVSLLIYGAVQAGYAFDYGELEGHPGTGEANWMAWYAVLPSVGPLQILTEDSTNCIDGEDVGYSDIYDIGLEIEPEDDFLEWIMQVENFYPQPYPNIPNYQPVNIIFGGLGGFSGTLWEYSINPWLNTEAFSDHGIVLALEDEQPACPILYEPTEGFPTTWTFVAEEPGIYLIYRSQNASGANNGASNGRYDYWGEVDTTTTNGFGSFTDPDTTPSWYIVFQVDANKNPIGCHSEIGDPTAVTIFGFEATYNTTTKAVDLVWQTTDEVDMLGYNVLRSTSEGGVKTQVNTELIDIDPDHSYDFTDDTVEMGTTYYYWIEWVETDDDRGTVGPEDVQTWFEHFMPLITL